MARPSQPTMSGGIAPPRDYDSIYRITDAGSADPTAPGASAPDRRRSSMLDFAADFNDPLPPHLELSDPPMHGAVTPPQDLQNPIIQVPQRAEISSRASTPRSERSTRRMKRRNKGKGRAIDNAPRALSDSPEFRGRRGGRGRGPWRDDGCLDSSPPRFDPPPRRPLGRDGTAADPVDLTSSPSARGVPAKRPRVPLRLGGFTPPRTMQQESQSAPGAGGLSQSPAGPLPLPDFEDPPSFHDLESRYAQMQPTVPSIIDPCRHYMDGDQQYTQKERLPEEDVVRVEGAPPAVAESGSSRTQSQTTSSQRWEVSSSQQQALRPGAQLEQAERMARGVQRGSQVVPGPPPGVLPQLPTQSQAPQANLPGDQLEHAERIARAAQRGSEVVSAPPVPPPVQPIMGAQTSRQSAQEPGPAQARGADVVSGFSAQSSASRVGKKPRASGQRSKKAQKSQTSTGSRKSKKSRKSVVSVGEASASAQHHGQQQSSAPSSNMTGDHDGQGAAQTNQSQPLRTYSQEQTTHQPLTQQPQMPSTGQSTT